MSRILVTGGCGYIGSALIPLLLDQERVAEVRVLDSLTSGSPGALMGTLSAGGLEFLEGDIRNEADVISAVDDVDAVIHLAGITGAATTHDREEETFSTNYDGTTKLLQASVNADVERFVFASSCNVYGRATAENLSESAEPEPINPYADSKLQAERIIREAIEEEPMTATSLRMSTVYGSAPGMRFNLVVNHFVFRALTGRSLTVYGDGTNWRPFIHVSDAARAYLAAAVEPAVWNEEVYNVGRSQGNWRIAPLADLVREELGASNIEYLEDERPGPSYHVNFDKLETTGFRPKWNVERGIQELADRFRGTEPVEGFTQ
jgi:nucleoside-diphosphate-sugar epimerase